MRFEITQFARKTGGAFSDQLDVFLKIVGWHSTGGCGHGKGSNDGSARIAYRRCHGYRIGLPQPGQWDEVLNTDAAAYGGSNMGNGGMISTEPVPSHGKPQSAALVLPPLGTLYFRLRQ